MGERASNFLTVRIFTVIMLESQCLRIVNRSQLIVNISLWCGYSSGTSVKIQKQSSR